MNTFCCQTLEEEVLKDELLCFMHHIPFTETPTPPTFFIQSDGGHGGMKQINFCPFCGTSLSCENQNPHHQHPLSCDSQITP
jgi:hypothetical protein